MSFVRFPSTPYLSMPPGVAVRADKVLTDAERFQFLSRSVHVEEKIDGENLGLSFDGEGVRLQARGSYVDPGGKHFRGISQWLAPREHRIAAALGLDLVLFGEWCTTTHSVYYDGLPDWFLVFDVYERSSRRFLDTPERDVLAGALGLSVVPFIAQGIFSESDLLKMIGRSRVGHQPMEGLVVRSVEHPGGVGRAKLVRPGFVQSIDQHWTRGHIERNRLAHG